MIVHCMLAATWEERRDKPLWGQRNLNRDGFIHCSSLEYFWRVAPGFEEVAEPMVLVLIDESRLTARVLYEDGDGCGRAYPHIYGLVNREAVAGVLPLLRDADGRYVKNPELAGVEDK